MKPNNKEKTEIVKEKKEYTHEKTIKNLPNKKEI